MAFGADAVYAGIPRFSLRAKENPYNNNSLKEDIEYCHQMGKKMYITANILPQNRKLESFKNSIAKTSGFSGVWKSKNTKHERINNTNDEIVKNKPMYLFGIVLKGYNKTIVNIVKIGNKNIPIICMFI